ncbi:uncharacterized protein PO1_contig-018-47 [Mycobacterium sp. PO1]|nr:uncharacterized protein PO1_contig-018-47 [Mycobacterium sp. PO1]GFM21852.1 uncharacterized protein PO2_contig-002-135 [Mycobacterium sp. PO2]
MFTKFLQPVGTGMSGASGLLGVSRANQMLAGLAGFPTSPRYTLSGLEFARSVGTPGPSRAPQRRVRSMSDKSPRQSMTKKSGKSLKEKRADKHAKAAAKASSASTVNDIKR